MERSLAASFWVRNNFWTKRRKADKILILTSRKSIIWKSGQAKKWNFLMSVLLCSGLIAIYCILALSLNFDLSDRQETIFFLIALFGIAICCIAIICLSLFIICPQCKLRWFWYGIAKDFKHNIMIGYMSNCQRCNYPEKSNKNSF